MLDGICKQIVQPKRVNYSKFDIECGYSRQDFDMKGLQCSLYKSQRTYSQICVLYLHSYNGCRLEAVDYVTQICKQGIDICTFDFQGCGQSDGDIITFGLLEQNNVELLYQYLKEIYQQLIIWGRSMGATTGLLFTKKQSEIKCLILDSPFLDLESVIINLIKQKLKIPNLISKGIYEIIKRQVYTTYGFKFNQIKINYQAECPMLLLASKNDSIIPYKHFQDIYNSYIGIKRIVHLQCDHHECRPKEIIQTIIGYINSLSPKTKLSPSRYPFRLMGDAGINQMEHISTGVKIKNKIMRNSSQSSHKNSAKIQKERALIQLSNFN